MKTSCKPNQLTWHDLQFALLRMPKALLTVMKAEDWRGKVFVGGGCLRSIVAGEPVNDVDVFVSCKKDGEQLARMLVERRLGFAGKKMSEEDHATVQKRIYKTDNALTLCCFTPTIQIIHRWVFETGERVADSFDFTCCCAAFWQTPAGNWDSYCDPRFYPDLAAKRLIYRNPVRNEDAGGSMLRVLKYYQKGYRIPLDCLSDVIARLVQGINLEAKGMIRKTGDDETCVVPEQFSKVICGLLREVDPNIDPSHIAHLPAENAGPEGLGSAHAQEAVDE